MEKWLINFHLMTNSLYFVGQHAAINCLITSVSICPASNYYYCCCDAREWAIVVRPPHARLV